MKSQFTILFLFCITCLRAQLLPSIGIGALPNDTDSICPIPLYTGSFDASGYHDGDTVPDFTLYDMNGDSVNLGASLQSGRPALLIAASYTCPVFRGKINDINTMASIYSGLIDIYVIYTVEAHPVVDVSPYSGTIWVPSANYSEGVLFEQPKTYGERKALVDSMLLNYTINVPILLDGLCNEWWLNFGPAPNNAYLINVDGTVFKKHPWFHKAPDNMYCAIDSLIGFNSGNCTSFGNDGDFSFTLDADSITYGLPGQTLEIHSTITNNSATDNVVMDIIKRQSNIPNSWGSALCADICYAATVDSIRITLPPSGVQPFIFYFYTDSIPNQGSVDVVFRNAYHPNNKFRQGFYGFTNSTSLPAIESHSFSVFPNPVNDVLYFFNTEISSVQYEIFDLAGRIILSGFANREIDVSGLRPGAYFLRIHNVKVVFVRE